MRTNEKLTGKTRYRMHRTLFGKELLVLQMEIAFEDGPPDENGMPIYLAGTQWRDAKVSDLSRVKS